MKLKHKNTFFVITILIVLLLVITRYNLMSRYSILTAKYDLMKGKLIYPQCEYYGKNLEIANKISKEFGFNVVYVDCEVFYTKGMKSYYSLMVNEIERINGKDWLDKFWENNKTKN